MQKGRIKALKYIVSLMAFIFISSFILTACSGTQAEQVESEKVEEKTVEKVTEEVAEEEPALKEEAIEGKKDFYEIGDVIKVGDLECVVTNYTLEEGSEDVNLLIEVSLTNHGDTDRKIDSMVMFDLVDKFDRSQTFSLSGPKDTIGTATIPPGETLVGTLPYIVSKDTKELNLKVTLDLSTEEVEFLINMLSKFFTGEEISEADMKRANELDERDFVIVKIYLEGIEP